MTKTLAPIVLFSYNRPVHTKKVLDALALNPEAKESILYVYCDGIKDESDIENLQKTEAVYQAVKNENRFKKVFVIRQTKNKGLANSIIDGVTEVVNKYGKIIVLEDDIVTSTGFLKYMNDGLQIYEKEEKVMHISGYFPPIKKKLPETFFYISTTCWGWGTWARSWKHFEKNPEKQIDTLNKGNLWKEFTVDYSLHTFKDQLELNRNGKLNTWAIFWYTSVFLNGGTSLHPYPSLVQNIGMDGSGVHFGSNSMYKNIYNWENLATSIKVEQKHNFEDKTAFNYIKKYFMPTSPTMKDKTRHLVKKIIKKAGFDIVRLPPHKKPSKITNNSASDKLSPPKPVIQHQQAITALKSVHRELHLSPFTYFKRPDKSSDSMEEIEKLWWNSNSRLIEKVWVLSENINRQYRGSYVAKASEFFKEKKKQTKVLDLGCGSGWFGRMIADKDLEYYGMDFSSTQIDIANSEKVYAGNKDYLHYVHAFLHHLYWDELHQLFEELVKVLPSGCRFFIVEPIFQNGDSKLQNPNQDAAFSFTACYRNYLNAIKQELISEGLYDTETEEELKIVIHESKTNHFFFSPKQVSFKLNEFESFLRKYVKIENKTQCGFLNLETAQFVDRITSKEKKEFYSKELFPFVRSLDELLISNHNFEANPNAYQFFAFECILNK
jgi:SAM-dependent methyltransferase